MSINYLRMMGEIARPLSRSNARPFATVWTTRPRPRPIRPDQKKPCSCANSPRLPRARKDRQGPRDRGIQGRPRVSPAAILLAAPDGTLCLLPLFSGIAQSHSCPGEAVTRPNATRERLQSTRRARAQSIVREAALATAGCVVASYGFAVPASAVITGTNAASMHAIPKAIIIIFDMTRTLKPNKETIGPKC